MNLRSFGVLFAAMAALASLVQRAGANSDETAAVHTGYQYGDTQPSQQTDDPGYAGVVRVLGDNSGQPVKPAPHLDCTNRGPVSLPAGGCPGPLTAPPEPVHDAVREKEQSLVAGFLALIKAARDAAMTVMLGILSSASHS